MHHIDYKFVLLAGSRLERFKETANQVFTFRCPYCGDSKKHVRRTRGFFLPDKESYRFYCHNCGKSCNFSTYLKEQAFDLFSSYKLERFGSSVNNTREIEDLVIPQVQFIETDSILKKCTVLEKCCGNLIEVRHYAEKRRLPNEKFSSLYAVEDVNVITSMLPRYNGIVFPNNKMLAIPFFREDRSYNFIQFRVVESDVPADLRFVTIQVNEGPKVYGEEYVDYSNPVYVLEGPIDAMHIDNALAIAGATANMSYIESRVVDKGPKINVCVLMDNDYRSNSHIRQRLVKSIRSGYSVVLFNDAFSGIKDINQAIVKFGWHPKEVNRYIRERTFHGLRAELELAYQMKQSS